MCLRYMLSSVMSWMSLSVSVWTWFWSRLCLQGSIVSTSDLFWAFSHPPSLCLCLMLPPYPSCRPLQQRRQKEEDRRGGQQMDRHAWKRIRWHADMKRGSGENARTLWSGFCWAFPGLSVQDDHSTNMWGSLAAPQAARRHLHKAALIPTCLALTWGSMWDSHSVWLPLLSPAPFASNLLRTALQDIWTNTRNLSHFSWCSLISQREVSWSLHPSP